MKDVPLTVFGVDGSFLWCTVSRVGFGFLVLISGVCERLSAVLGFSCFLFLLETFVRKHYQTSHERIRTSVARIKAKIQRFGYFMTFSIHSDQQSRKKLITWDLTADPFWEASDMTFPVRLIEQLLNNEAKNHRSNIKYPKYTLNLYMLGHDVLSVL